MNINCINAKGKSPEFLKKEVQKRKKEACVIHNIPLKDFDRLALILREKSKRKIYTQFSTVIIKPSDVFLIDKKHEISFNGRQIMKKRKVQHHVALDFKTIIENSLNEIYIFNSTNLKFEFVNQGALDNLGYTLEQMRQMHALEIKPFMTKKTFYSYLNSLKDGKQDKVVYETVQRRADGTDYPVEVHLQLMKQDHASFFTAIILDITDWEKINKESSDRLDKMSILAQNYPDGSITLLDKNLKILFTEGEGYQKHGIDPKTFTGLPAKEVLAPEVYSQLEIASREIKKDKIIYEVGFKERIYQNTLKAVFDKKNQFNFFVLKVFDITEYKKQSEQINLEKNKYASIFNALNKSSLVSITEANGIIVHANEAFCNTSKYEENELIGKSHNIINSGHHPRAFWTDMWKTVFSGETWRADVKNKAKDGSFYWVDTTITPIFDAVGKISKLLSIRYLITEKKELAYAKDALTEKLALATKAVKMGVWTYDVETRAIFWDNRMLEIYRIKTFDFQFETFENLIHENDRAHELKTVFEYFEDENVFEYDFQYRVNTKNDEEVYVRGKAAIERENGKAKKVIGVAWDCTKDKKKEAELEKAKIDAEHTAIELKEAQKIAMLGSWHLDVKTNEVIWSEELYKMYGFDPTLPVPPYTEHMKLFTNDSWNLLSKELSKTAEQGTPYELELQTIKQDGSNGWMWVRGEALFDTHKKIVGLRGIAQDITNKKNNEIRLKESEEMVASIANNIPGIIWRYIINIDGTSSIDYISEGAEIMWGVSRDEILKDISVLWKMIHPDDVTDLAKSIEYSSQTMTPWKHEYRIIMANGRIKWLSVAGQPKKLANGSILWYSMALDVTAKREAEIELEKTLKQLNLSIETVKLGIWESSLTKGDLHWNDQMFEIFGLEKNSFDNKLETFNRMVHPDDLERANAEMSKIAQGNVVNNVRFRIIRPDGKTRHIYASGAPGFNNKGEVEKFIGVNIDVTHIAEYQEQLEAAIKEKDSLFKELHHRIKNNLQMISSLLFIKSTMTNEITIKQFIDETRVKIQSISAIHEQLLQMQGVAKLDIKSYLESLCLNLVKTYAYGNKEYALKMSIDSAQMSIDRVLIIGLIVNEIISNAIKYAYPETGSGPIHVVLTNTNTNTSELTVADEGIGMSHETTSYMKHSYGMQLINIFTKQLGGTIDLQYTKGTKFIFNFPTHV